MVEKIGYEEFPMTFYGDPNTALIKPRKRNNFQGKRAELGVYDDALDSQLPHIIIESPEGYPPQLNEKIVVSIKYINPNNPDHNFTCESATLVRRIKEKIKNEIYTSAPRIRRLGSSLYRWQVGHRKS